MPIFELGGAFPVKSCVKIWFGLVEPSKSYLNFPRLKATNERQDDGAGMLHQVAQFPIDQVYFIYTRPPCPSPATQGPGRQGTGC